jgi:hypothetical protein
MRIIAGSKLCTSANSALGDPDSRLTKADAQDDKTRHHKVGH